MSEKALREERQSVWTGAADIIESAKREGRELTAEERTDVDARFARIDVLEADIEREKRYAEMSQGQVEVAESRGVTVDEKLSKEERAAKLFNSYLKRGWQGVEAEKRASYDANGLAEAGFQASGSQGGYLVPQGFWDNLVIAMKAYGGLLGVANVIDTATGTPMDFPTNDPTAEVGAIIGEGIQDAYQETSFGHGQLQAWTYTSKVILASLELINDSAFDVDSFVRDRVAERIGRAVAQHLQTGSGSGQPLGIQTALAAVTGTTGGALTVTGASATGTQVYAVSGGDSGGVYQPAGADKVTTLTSGTAGVAKSTGVIGFDDLLAMEAQIDPAYRGLGNCQWVMTDAVRKGLRSVTDSYGHPLWEPNVQVGGQDGLYGYSYTIDQNAGAVTAGSVGGLLFGDFQRAMVVRRVNQAEVMRLSERYADARQVGYFGFIRLDARSVDLRAAVAYAGAQGS